MARNWKVGVGLLAAMVLIAFLFSAYPGQSAAQKDMGKGSYSVVSTDGAHLIVVDNATGKLYFYAIDKEGKIGDELKLRGHVDLHDVGKPSIKPVDAKPAK
jgi:hypothetical protein